jgi:hypothetical protein
MAPQPLPRQVAGENRAEPPDGDRLAEAGGDARAPRQRGHCQTSVTDLSTSPPGTDLATVTLARHHAPTGARRRRQPPLSAVLDTRRCGMRWLSVGMRSSVLYNRQHPGLGASQVHTPSISRLNTTGSAADSLRSESGNERLHPGPPAHPGGAEESGKSPSGSKLRAGPRSRRGTPALTRCRPGTSCPLPCRRSRL